MCPECHFRLELLAQDSVVVNFTVDCQKYSTIIADQWLSPTVDSDNTQPLMSKDRVVGNNVPAPIRTAMANGLSQLQSLRLEFVNIGMLVASEYTTHDCSWC
jgi:hypothetical protein